MVIVSPRFLGFMVIFHLAYKNEGDLNLRYLGAASWNLGKIFKEVEDLRKERPDSPLESLKQEKFPGKSSFCGSFISINLKPLKPASQLPRKKWYLVLSYVLQGEIFKSPTFQL